MSILDNPRTIESLRGMLDELCSPDLTLGRAKILRCRLAQLLETLDSSSERASDGPGTHREARI